MLGVLFGHPFTALVAPVLLSSIAFKHLLKKKASKYDVFLSFCNEDAPKNFANSLRNSLVNAGFCVSKADNRQGKKIGPDLVQAIKNSKILIPILSLKYASSEGCLDELVQIMECKNDSSGHIVLPIFYGVERCEIDGLGQKVDDEPRRRAAIEVSSLKGWESQNVSNGDEGQLVELVARKLFIELQKPLELNITEDSVGIKTPMKKVMDLVHSGDSTLYIGIYGKGGIGKTTLAKVIYNKLSDEFDHRSFIADVKETCECNGIEYLQNQLLLDILKKENEEHDKDKLITSMSSEFKDKKVLIILDDVNANHHLEALVGEQDWFAPGSRIIVTTRNKSVLDCAKVYCQYEYMEMMEMNKDEAKSLFVSYAFRRDSPPDEFFTLVDEVVSTIQCYPLTLEIIGSYLYGKSQASWENTKQELQKWQKSQELQEYKELPQLEVQELLKIVYATLESEQKKIFLDIACSLVGNDARIAPYMWEARDFNLVQGFEELVFVSLVKIGDNYKLTMHDEVRDFGRSIVYEGHCNEPDKGSRLWDYEEALKMLGENEGTGNIVQALSLDKGNSKETVDLDSENSTDEGCQNYTSDQFTNLMSLRFLHVRDANLTGDFSEIFSKLRWLRWERCPQALKVTNFGIEELAILDLSKGMISDYWEGWELIKSAEKLKVLNLTGCCSLEKTFFLSDFKNLEILILRNCDKLNNIESIQSLEALVSLDLSGCSSLEELPEEVGCLKGLKELFLDQTEIREIPSTIGSLKKLEILSAKGCKLAQLPNSICQLVNLSTIVMSDCIKPLPDNIWSLGKLERLSLQSCCELRLNRNLIVKLKSLTELVITQTGITELPESIKNLQNLEILNVSLTGIEMLPNAIGRLRKLRELDASWCRKLSEVIPSICKLSSLQRLNLLGCGELQWLPELPSNLTVVGVTCNSPELPSFSHLNHLKQLQLHNCSSLKCIPELPLTLVELEILECGALVAVEGLKVSLERLEIKRCNFLKKLDLSQLNHLRILYALDCKKLLAIEGLDKLDHLASLIIRGGTSVEIGKLTVAFKNRA